MLHMCGSAVSTWDDPTRPIDDQYGTAPKRAPKAESVEVPTSTYELQASQCRRANSEAGFCI